jgi:hypothetical protein
MIPKSLTYDFSRITVDCMSIRPASKSDPKTLMRLPSSLFAIISVIFAAPLLAQPARLAIE